MTNEPFQTQFRLTEYCLFTHRFMMILQLAFYAGMFILTAGQIDISNLKTNGLTMQKMGSVYAYEEIWRVMAVLPVSDILSEPERIRSNIKQLETYKNILKEENEINNMKTLINEFYKLLHTITEFNMIITGNKKIKREAWFPSIGSGIQYFFGNPDEETTRFIISRIEENKLQNKKNLEFIQNQTVITSELTNNIQSQNEQSNQQISALIDQINDILKTQYETINKTNSNYEFLFLSQILTLTIMRYSKFQNKLIEQILSNSLEHIEPELIPYSDLKKMMGTIEHEISETKMLPSNLFKKGKDLALYRLIPMKTYIVDGYISFELNVPVISRNQKELYAISSTPTYTGDTEVFSYIVPSAPYITTNKMKNEIGYLEQSDLNNCLVVSEDEYICAENYPIYTRQPKNNFCELTLLTNAFEESNNCVIKTIPRRDLFIKLHFKGQYYFITNKTVLAKSDCHGKTNDIKINGSGIISIGAGCSLYNQNFRITIQVNRGMKIDKKYESSLVQVTEKNVTSQIKKNNNNKYIVPENGMISLNENYEKIKEQLKFNKILQDIEMEKKNNIVAQNISITIDLFYIFIFIIIIIYVMIKMSNKKPIRNPMH